LLSVRVKLGSTSRAGMAELADAADSKSADRKVVGVRPPLPAPQNFKNKPNKTSKVDVILGLGLSLGNFDY
jgi:hypothetical protein